MVRHTLDDEDTITRSAIDTDTYNLYKYFDYNDNNLIHKVATTSSRARRIEYTYDEEDRVIGKTMTVGTPVAETFGYNEDGFVSTHTVTSSAVNNSYGYAYDDNGNITEITKGGVVQQSYVYDDKSQLVRENNRDINKTIVYAYDNSGNILSKTEYAFTTGELGAVTDKINYLYDGVWKDKLVYYGTKNEDELIESDYYNYDAIGNPTSYKGATLTWNGRQLVSYTKDGLTVTYKYDADGSV